MDEAHVSKGILKEIAERNGFEIIDDQNSILVENVKSILIKNLDFLMIFHITSNI